MEMFDYPVIVSDMEFNPFDTEVLIELPVSTYEEFSKIDPSPISKFIGNLEEAATDEKVKIKIKTKIKIKIKY